MAQPIILIIDDDVNHFDIISALLKQQNYNLRYANSGKQAINSLDIFQPELILLDGMMPELDGFQVCAQIKSMPQWKNVPIIMVTALNSQTALAKALDAGADDFIGKPVEALELRARVKSMLRIRQQFNQNQILVRQQTQTIKLLEKTLSELRGNLATSFSHEINTPLHGISSPLEFLSLKLQAEEDEEIHELLTWIRDSVSRLDDLTTKFKMYLELELLENQDITVQEDDDELIFDSDSSFDVVIPKLYQLAEKYNRQNDLVLDINEAKVAVPEKYFATILYELVDNALKFSTSEDLVTVSSEIIGQDSLTLSVVDEGRGMTEEQILRIGSMVQFERDFYEQQGLGLGLYLVKKIVQLSGGSFQIESVYGQGTKISIGLPLVCHQDLYPDMSISME